MDKDNNQQNMLQKQDQDSLVFKDSPEMNYLYKKIERLVSALFMLAGVLSDKEPLKFELKSSGLVLLGIVLETSDKTEIRQKLFKISSLLEVAFVGGIISAMNRDVFKNELNTLLDFVSELEQKDNTKIVFPEHFLEIEKPDFNQALPSIVRSSVSDNLSVKKSQAKPKDKSNRQEIILSLLNKNGALGIKDFVSEISDCSEKTIQRELVSLVAKGLVKKEGEKRWSKYSLKA